MTNKILIKEKSFWTGLLIISILLVNITFVFSEVDDKAKELKNTLNSFTLIRKGKEIYIRWPKIEMPNTDKESSETSRIKEISERIKIIDEKVSKIHEAATKDSIEKKRETKTIKGETKSEETSTGSFINTFKKGGFEYTLKIDMPKEIKIDDTKYTVIKIKDQKIDLVGNVREVTLVVRPEGCEKKSCEQEIIINRDDFNKYKIKEVKTSVKITNKQKIEIAIGNFKSLKTIFSYVEEMFPNLKEAHSAWLKNINSVISFLNSVAKPVNTLCKSIFTESVFTGEENEKGTRVVSTGGSAAFFIDGKKQIVINKDKNKMYYYRYSFGIDPNIMIKPSVSDKKVKISVYAVTDTGKTYSLNMDEDEAREKYKTFYDSYYYSNGFYSDENFVKVCMSYLGSLTDLTEDAREFLASPFCVKFHLIKDEEKNIIE